MDEDVGLRAAGEDHLLLEEHSQVRHLHLNGTFFSEVCVCVCGGGGGVTSGLLLSTLVINRRGVEAGMQERGGGGDAGEGWRRGCRGGVEAGMQGRGGGD